FASAAITFRLWMIIWVLAMMLIMPILFRIFARDHKEEGKQIKKGLRTAIMLAVSLFAFDSSMRVYGTPEEIIGPAEVWFNVFYIALGAVVVWKIYLVFVQHVISKMSTNKRIEQRDMDVEPLLRLFGKLVLWVMAVAMIMSAWGFDLTYIITSAGIISLGITLGAQNVLSQFFSGMVLLLTRPFKSGDLVKIGGGNTIYKVYSVNIMNTVFENWDNEETVIMPNNAVSSSTIVNLTGDGLIYKITVFMNIAYDDDIDLAKDIMKKAAMDHPSVITDGSVDAPSTRVTAFLDSSIEVRLTCYVYDFNDNGRIGGDLRESIFKKFKEQGISVPFPQRDVHVKVVREDDAKKDAED
ncbi:MAG: mechanosensitive ion channel, partial [Candidatus Methanoplasma sp.]|nr:mechanosensitive ion channel [Candidatus Methanoplasma sp.]